MLLKESSHRDYDRLARFLRGISLRFQLLATLDLILRLAAGFILVLLGSIIALELRGAFPYLSFSYCLLALISLSALLVLGLWRLAFRPSMEQVARGLEEKYPQLRDDVTNSLLLFRQMGDAKPGQISEGLITAQIHKTANEIGQMKPQEVVSFKRALRHLKILLPLGLAFFGVLTLDPQFLNRSLDLIARPWAALPEKETFISLEPPDSIVRRGSPVVIQARIKGDRPDRLMLMIWPEGREMTRVSMDPQGKEGFSYRIPSTQFSFRYQAYYSRASSPVYSLRVVDPPDVGKIKLTLIPPDYTGLPMEVREEGHIEALKGTVANVEVQATKVVSKARIELNEGNQLPLEVREDRLRGALLIFYPGAYSIRVQDELGFENLNPVQYQIRLIPDQYPEGEITSPDQDLEISGNEILPIAYKAKDDFGITAVRLSYQVRGRERLINLKSLKGTRSLGPEIFPWDLASLALLPGDRVGYRLEVEDNDSVSGPKVGYSRSFYLSVKDERSQAAKEGEEAQRIAEALLDLLGDHLEATKDQKAMARRMEEVLKDVDRNLERLGSRVERFDLEALRRNLASLKKRMPEEPGETATQELERLALLAEDLAKRARMNEVEALARELKNRQRRLLETLQELKGRLTDKDLEAILKELDRLEELIRSVMEALSRLASRLPDEFINSPNLHGLEFQDMFKDLAEIRQRLKAGDLSAALEAAQRLLQALSEMMASLGRAGAQAGMGSLNKLQGEMARQSGELDKILFEQREILSETEGIDQEVKRKELLTPDHQKKFPDLSLRQDQLKERTKGLLEKLEMLAQLFPGMDTEILKALKEGTGSMGKAAGKLQGEDAPGAIPPEQDALRWLSKSQQGMQQMAQQMASQMQAARWGYPWGYDPRPGWYYGPWAPMPTLPQPEVKRPRERGYTGIDREEFEPPSKDAYRVPGIFREKVLEGLKEEAPSPYKRKVERYFRGLTE